MEETAVADVCLLDKKFRLYIHASQIEETVKKMVQKVADDLGEDACPVFVGVLNGVFMFMSDFVRHYPHICQVSFLKMSSYQGTGSTGSVKTLVGINEDLSGRTVVVLEDIVDTGNTLVELHNLFKDKGIKDFRVATLFFKPESYNKSIPIEYVGMDIDNRFIVGYGLDYNGMGRNLPHIYQNIEDK